MPSIVHDPVTREPFTWWSRSDWGARPPKSTRPLSSTREGVFVHHTVTLSGPDVPSILRGVQAHHMDGNGWQDIAYSYAVGVGGEHDGHIFELRGYGVQGGHTEGMNSHSHAVVLVGDFDVNRVTDTAKRAVVAVVRLIEQRAGARQRVRCHGDVASTACPGRHAREWVHAGLPVRTAEVVAGQQPEQEDLSMKALKIAGSDAQWLVWVDGSGRERKTFLDGSLRVLLQLSGAVTDTFELVPGVEGYGVRHDDLIARLQAIPDAAPMHLHEHVMATGIGIVAYIAEHVLPALAELTGRPIPGDVDETELAAALAGPLADAVADKITEAGVEVGLDPEQVAELVGRVRLTLTAQPEPEG